MSFVLVFAEVRDGKLKRVSLEALCEARRLFPSGEIHAVTIGDTVSAHLEELSETGANQIDCCDSPALRFYSSERYAQIVVDLAKKDHATLILMGATAMGRDLAAKVAAKLHAPFAQDCTAFEIKPDGDILATRPIYGGKVMAKVRKAIGESCLVATIRPNAFPAQPSAGDARPQVKNEPVIKKYAPPSFDESKPAARTTEVIAAAVGKLDLTEAQVIVSGGRGLREAANFSLIEELAGALGAAVGASRAAVDAGWKPHPFQVGLTGKTVSPLLYIACGISGAIQHQAGMSSAKCIVAINKDQNAPIFKIADYGIVGDLFEIIPRLTNALKK
ncbi:MAG: electron transfer flavoprotein subunit alpha/FixB family protein [Nitrospirota bacterium]